MITLTLIAVTGVGALIFAMTFFVNRASGLRARAARAVEEDVRGKLRQAQEATASFVPRIIEGAPVEQALNELQKSLAAILTPDRPIEPHLWDLNDLEQFRRTELGRRCEEVNRKTLVPALGVALAIVAATVMALAITYSHIASQATVVPPSPSGADAPLPGDN